MDLPGENPCLRALNLLFEPMKTTFAFLLLGFLAFSCAEEKPLSSTNPVNWENRRVRGSLPDSLGPGTSYLSVYSQVYSLTEHRTHDLTVTVSMRNTSPNDTLYLQKAEYFNTHGVSIRTYFDEPIFVAPLETVEIVIEETDREGGTGANFIFDWALLPGAPEPLFEAIMISTSGQQGLSFSTQGTRIR
jgi:hypothetical protein